MLSAALAAHRIRTFASSWRAIARLTPKQVDDFLESYVIYGLDWSDEPRMISALGPDYAKKVGDCLVAYYSVLNHLCALGSVEKMYIPPNLRRGAGILQNQVLYEESIATDLGLKPGHRVLDLGCGRGRVAAHLAELSGARITGVNIDADQLASARAFNQERGLQNEFLQRDFNELPLPFADRSFDAFYHIQALSLCKSLPALFKELFRVLKPGARLSSLDWASLPAYQPGKPEHAELMRRVKPLIGAVGTPTPALFEEAARSAGFELVRSDNASLDGLQADLIGNADLYFRGLRVVITGLVAARVVPKHFKTLIDRLTQDGQAFVEMDRQRLATTTYRLIARKPLAA